MAEAVSKELFHFDPGFMARYKRLLIAHGSESGTTSINDLLTSIQE